MKKVLCYFSATSLADPIRAEGLRERLTEAIAQGLEPQALPHNSARRALDVPDELYPTIEAIALRSGLAPGRVIGGLVLALENHRSTAAQSRGVPVLTGLRSTQQQSVSVIAEHLRSGRWVLFEAGTGSGKSRMAAHLCGFVLTLRDLGHTWQAEEIPTEQRETRSASPDGLRARIESRAAKRVEAIVDAQQQAPRCVIVAAPSLDNLRHLIAEFDSVQPHIDPQRLWRVGIVLGRRQFVSRSALLELLDAQPVADSGVEAWLKAGMPAGLTQGSRMLLELHPGICGLADDLRHVAKDFPIEDALLDATSPEDESEWYGRLREAALTADILFVSHMMLAADTFFLQRDRVRLLPAPLAVVIDEAHAFENAVAEVDSSGVAISRLLTVLAEDCWAEIRCKTQAAKALAVTREIERALKAIPQDIPLPDTRIRDPRSLEAWLQARPLLVKLKPHLDVLHDALRNATGVLRSARTLIAETRTALAGITLNYNGAVTFSAVRRYPHLIIGPRSVQQILSVRWQSTPCGLLMSGTLLYPGVNGPLSAPVIAGLMMPIKRTVSAPPLHPHWLKSTPTVYLPSESAAAGFAPPGGDLLTDGSIRQWLTHVGLAITRSVAPFAAGGTLVLMTGYGRINILADVLRPELGSRLIVQDGERLTMALARTEFIGRSIAGQRPIWLATGIAGTGLDLRDERFTDAEAERDFLLSDLVIPALPFGMTRNSIHLAKSEWLGFTAEKQEALRLFQQWLGRLIRREGLKQRRIWLLDGRLLLPASRRWTHEFLKIAMSYPKQKTVPIEG